MCGPIYTTQLSQNFLQSSAMQTTQGSVSVSAEKVAEQAEEQQLPQEYQDLEIYEGKEFVKKAYERMTEEHGYGKYAPKLKISKEKDMNKGYYDYKAHTIGLNVLDKDGGLTCSKKKVLEIISHELWHFQQHIDMERGKDAGFGINSTMRKAKMQEAKKRFEKNPILSAMAIVAAPKIDWGEYSAMAAGLAYGTDAYLTSARSKPIKKIAKEQGSITETDPRSQNLAAIQEGIVDYKSVDPKLIKKMDKMEKKGVDPNDPEYQETKRQIQKEHKSHSRQFVEQNARSAEKFDQVA